MKTRTFAPCPLFRDPIYDGAADPTIIWNELEQSWWLVYTSRRANVHTQGVAWAHGTHLGIASSNDNGQTWLYRGEVELEYARGKNTYWAPEIIEFDGIYHMYVSFVEGVPVAWKGDRYILHYVSNNLWDWTFESRLNLSSQRVIDACVARIDGKGWRMWYKDESDDSKIYCAQSLNLFDWDVIGPALDEIGHEGPNVFFWHSYYWMMTDSWNGLTVFRSIDAIDWEFQSIILDKPGIRSQDTSAAHHPDILINNGNAYIFYFTHPNIRKSETINVYSSDQYEMKRSVLQVAKLKYDDNTIICDRNASFDFILTPPRINENMTISYDGTFL